MIYGDRFTRNGTVLVVVHPGVYRRFATEARARSFLRYYRMCGG